MSRRIAFSAAVLVLSACSAKRAAPTPDLTARPELAVFHTDRGVYAVPVAVGASSWKVDGARIEPDADNDGIPASMDESEGKGGCAGASPFSLQIRGEEVAVSGARVIAKSGNVATVMSPFGNIQLVVDHADVRPGAHVSVVGVRDERSPLDTVKAKSAVILCDAPPSSSYAMLPVSARLVQEPAANPLRPPLASAVDSTELAHR